MPKKKSKKKSFCKAGPAKPNPVKPVVAPAPPQPEVLPPFRVGAGSDLDFAALQADVEALKAMDPNVIRELLLKQLELASLRGIKCANDTLRGIQDKNTDEAMRELLIGRLGKYSFFTESVTRQRMLILKAGFISDRPPEERKDAADLTEAEWVAKYQPQLTIGT